MAWDKDLPSFNEKIRNLSTVITSNNKAIEEGSDIASFPTGLLEQRSIQLSDRNAVATGDDPTTNAGTQYIYSKVDGAAAPAQELFTRDSAGNIVQLTTAGVIGNPDVQLSTTGVKHLNATITNTQQAYCTAWIHFILGNPPTLVNAYNMNLPSRKVDGEYECLFTTPMINDNYSVSCSARAQGGSSTSRVVNVGSSTDTSVNLYDTTGFQIIVRALDGSKAGTGEIFLQVFGGQA